MHIPFTGNTLVDLMWTLDQALSAGESPAQQMKALIDLSSFEML